MADESLSKHTYVSKNLVRKQSIIHTLKPPFTAFPTLTTPRITTILTADTKGGFVCFRPLYFEV